MAERVLLVEGGDDLHVLSNFFKVREVPSHFAIRLPGAKEQDAEDEEIAGGDTVLLKKFCDWLVRSDLDCLAIVLDSNAVGPSARWQSIRQRLINAGYDAAGIPKRHDENGTVVSLSLEAETPRSVRFSTWFMPDNRSLGMIEDFVLGLVREKDMLLPRVDHFLDSIPSAERRFSAAHRSKARVHTWLAVSERPGRPMGQAIACDGCLDALHPSTRPFLAWVKRALLD